MPKIKVTVTVDARLRRARLARECAKLDPREEAKLAEEGLAAWVDSDRNAMERCRNRKRGRLT